MASIRRLKKDDASSPWVVEYTDQSGKRRRCTPKSGLKKDAERERQRIESEMASGIHTAADDTVTVRAGVEELERDLERRVKLGDITRGSLVNYRSCLRRGVVPRFGSRKLTTITADEVQQWVDEMRLRYMPRTVFGYHLAMVLLLNLGVRKKWLKRNVLRDEPCRLPSPQKRQAVPSRADLKALMAAVKTIGLNEDVCSHVVRRTFVALGVFGGLRPGEIYGLQWENVDFAGGVVRVRHSLSRTDGLKGPKSAAGVRDIPMTMPIREALLEAAWYANLRSLTLASGSQNGSDRSRRLRRLWEKRSGDPELTALVGYVCQNRLGGPRFSESNNNLWGRLMKDAGLVDEVTGQSKFTPHALRHAAASLFIEAGLPALNLKTLIGHSSVNTTYNVYGHLFPEDQRTANAAHDIANRLTEATETRQLSVSH